MFFFWCFLVAFFDGFFFFKQKTAYEMRISDWSSDVCSSDLLACVKQGSDLPLLGCKGLGPGIFERTYRNDGQARIDLHTRHRVTGRGANERFLEVGVRYGFIGADKTRAKLHA